MLSSSSFFILNDRLCLYYCDYTVKKQRWYALENISKNEMPIHIQRRCNVYFKAINHN